MIVVTTPTGTIGHQVLENLLDSGEPIRVIARDPSRLPSPIRTRVEVVQGSHGDNDVVDQAIRSMGVFFSPISGDRKLPSCATRDVAAVAASLLLDSSWSGQESVPVLGPADLSFNDMARIMSEVLGKRVRFQQVSGETYKARLKEHGMSEAMAAGMLDMMVAKNQGLDNAEPCTPQSTTRTSFRQWCKEVLKPAVSANGASDE